MPLSGRGGTAQGPLGPSPCESALTQIPGAPLPGGESEDVVFWLAPPSAFGYSFVLRRRASGSIVLRG